MKLAVQSLDWALTHIERYGDTNIFPVPFEYRAIREQWDSEIRRYLAAKDIEHWVAQPFRRCLTSKHRFGFRIATQLDPLDCIIFTAIIFELGADIEAKRIDKSKEVVISSRFAPKADGTLYDDDFRYQRFQDVSARRAKDPSTTHVVVADIADFFLKIYTHPLENALAECTTKKLHLTALKKILSQWNSSVSYGIPVGPLAAFMLAELVLNDVDRGLDSVGAIHCRWYDDFRIFCRSEREAYSQLTLLANSLFESQGLTLEATKTEIISSVGFLEQLKPKWLLELTNLSKNFNQFLKEIGIENKYEEIDIESLAPEAREQLENLNLADILRGQVLSTEPLDESIVRFALRRLAQIDQLVDPELLISHSERLYPVFVDIVKYFQRLRGLSADARSVIGKALLEMLQTTSVGDLPHVRLWILSLFASDTSWNNSQTLVPLYDRLSDQFAQRELILAMGRSHQLNWFKTRRRDINEFSPWRKRAFLAAASCLPVDEYNHWCGSIMGSLTFLDKVVVSWAKRHRF